MGHIGIDVHKREGQICILAEGGELIERRIRTEVERFADTIAVTGVDTHICVESTVRQGYDLGYRMIVLADLVATRRSELSRHENSLAVCERYFGLVVESKVLLETLNTRS